MASFYFILQSSLTPLSHHSLNRTCSTSSCPSIISNTSVRPGSPIFLIHTMYTLKAHEESTGNCIPLAPSSRAQRRTDLGLSTRVKGRGSPRGRASPALSVASSSAYSTSSSVDYNPRSSSPPSSSSSSQFSATASRHSSLPSPPLALKSPAVNLPTTYAPYAATSKYFQFKRSSTTLTAVLASSLLATSFLSQFPALSEAQAINTDITGGGSGLPHLLTGASLGGQWDLIGHSGVSAMHAVLRPFTESVLFLERVQSSTFAKAQGSSATGGNKGDKFAWSTEFSPKEGEWRSLDVKSNMFCSAGGYLPDGVRVVIFERSSKTHALLSLLFFSSVL